MGREPYNYCEGEMMHTSDMGLRWEMRWKAFEQAMRASRHFGHNRSQTRAQVKYAMRRQHPEAMSTVLFIARLKMGLVAIPHSCG